jgi:RimJ/RimL family protein N-acetyltransferase
VTLRVFTMADAALVYHWRFDKAAVQYSGSHDVASWDSHVEFCERIVKDKSKQRAVYMWIAERNDQPVGYVRLNATDTESIYRISIAVDPEMRGCGIGTRVIELCGDWCDHHRYQPIATIREDNIGSIKAFESAGYKKDETQVDASLWTFSRLVDCRCKNRVMVRVTATRDFNQRTGVIETSLCQRCHVEWEQWRKDDSSLWVKGVTCTQ